MEYPPLVWWVMDWIQYIRKRIQRWHRQMITSGGLLSEFKSNTKPDKHNFPSRNRVVAGISDATVVIESGEKGGSNITANLAWEYNRDVFAVPGTND